MKKPLVILTGPTAVGKTETSLWLAKKIGGEIISADSMQVYRGMDIGSAKIMPDEMQGIPHHLIDVLDPNEEFNVVRFQEMAKQAMDAIYANGHIPIITGGTGFYIQALLYDIDFTETESDTSLRTELERLASQNGAEWLHEELRKVDPESAEAIHANNIKRTIRALEYYRQTGKKISMHNEKERQKESPYAFTYFVLNRPRTELYNRIDKRVDIMLKQGLVNEVSRLREAGYLRSSVAMQGLGYKEIYDYLDGEISLEEAVYRIKRDTRHFAKRQLTWFHREKCVTWVDMEQFADRKLLQAFLLEHLYQDGVLINE